MTSLSRGELQDVLAVAEPPVCLLGGWAVHVYANDGFRAAHDRDYVGSRDIDHVADYDVVKADVRSRITDDRVAAFESTVDADLYDRTARLLDVDSTVVRQSIERLFV